MLPLVSSLMVPYPFHPFFPLSFLLSSLPSLLPLSSLLIPPSLSPSLPPSLLSFLSSLQPVTVLLKKLRKQTTDALIKRRQELIKTLHNVSPRVGIVERKQVSLCEVHQRMSYDSKQWLRSIYIQYLLLSITCSGTALKGHP